MTTNERIVLLDPRRSLENLWQDLQQAFERVMRSGHYIQGPEVEGFEKECADYLKVREAIGVSSGTDALIVALMALDIGPGDEVICPTFTFFATAGSIWRVGAKPVFVDCDPVTFNMDPNDVARKINSKTKAIIPVHLFGQSADLDSILALAKKHSLFVIEDAAQAIGAHYQNRPVGGFGDIGCFSFFPAKNLGAYGDAGLVTTQDPKLGQKIRMLRTHGGLNKYEHPLVGGNFRLDALQAALLRVRLPHLENYTQARQHNAERYTQKLSQMAQGGKKNGQAPLILPKSVTTRHVYNQYVVRIKNGRRDALQNFLREQHIDTAVYYPLCLHQQECFRSLNYRAEDFPVSQQLSREVLALPIYAELRESELNQVVEKITAFFS